MQCLVTVKFSPDASVATSNYENVQRVYIGTLNWKPAIGPNRLAACSVCFVFLFGPNGALIETYFLV